MTKKGEEVSPKFQLRAIELHELGINKMAPGFTVNNFNFEINIEANVDQNQKLVIAATRIKIFADDHVTELGKITCACVFSIANFEEVVTGKNETEFELVQPFADTINSICISTTRGFMASSFKGTILHHAFLPIIDIKSLAKTNLRGEAR
jgi:hypothetical protein